MSSRTDPHDDVVDVVVVDVVGVIVVGDVVVVEITGQRSDRRGCFADKP